MNGADRVENGTASVVGEQKFSLLKNPLQKFAGSDLRDLLMTKTLLKRLGSMPEKAAKRKFLKLPPAYQQCLAYVYETGWPPVDLEELFDGTICPDNSYQRGAEVLAEMACCQICSKPPLDLSNMKRVVGAPESLDAFLDSGEESSAQLRILIDQMKKDLMISSQHLSDEEENFLADLIQELDNKKTNLERVDLRNRVVLLYARLNQADNKAARNNGRSRRKTSNLPTKHPVSEMPKLDVKPKRIGKDDVAGWKRRLLTDELGIQAPVSKDIWINAFKSLSGSERDVVRFCGKGGSYSGFSRKYYGSNVTAGNTYRRALEKLFKVLNLK